MMELKGQLAVEKQDNKENREITGNGNCQGNGKCNKCEALIITNGELVRKMKR